MNYSGNMPDWHQYNLQPPGPQPTVNDGTTGQNVNAGHLAYMPNVSPSTLNGLNPGSEVLDKHQRESGYARHYQSLNNNVPNTGENVPLASMMQMQPCVGHYGPTAARNPMMEGYSGPGVDPRNGAMGGMNEDHMGYRNNQVPCNGPMPHLNGSNLNTAVGSMGPRNPGQPGPVTSGRVGPPSYVPCKGPCCNPDANVGYQQWEKFGSYPANASYRENAKSNVYQENRRYGNYDGKEMGMPGMPSVDHRRNYSEYKHNVYHKDPIVGRNYPSSSGMVQNYPMQNYNYPTEYQKYPYPMKEYQKMSGMNSGVPANPRVLKHQEQNFVAQQTYNVGKQMQYQNGCHLAKSTPTSSVNATNVMPQNMYFNAQFPRNMPTDVRDCQESGESAPLMNRVQASPMHSAHPQHQMFQQKLAMQRYTMENHLRELSKIPGYQSHPKYKECILKYREILKFQQSANYKSQMQQGPQQRIPTPAGSGVPPINLQFDQNGVLINSSYLADGFRPSHLPESCGEGADKRGKEHGMNSESKEKQTNRSQNEQLCSENLQMQERYSMQKAQECNVERRDGKFECGANRQKISKEFADKPELDVRQFLANWDESEEEEGVPPNFQDVVLDESTPVVVLGYENAENLDLPKIMESVEASKHSGKEDERPPECLTIAYSTLEDSEISKITEPNGKEIIKSGSIIHCISNGSEEIPTIHIVDNLEINNILEVSSEQAADVLETQEAVSFFEERSIMKTVPENFTEDEIREETENKDDREDNRQTSNEEMNDLQVSSKGNSRQSSSLRKQSSEELQNPDDISLPDLPTSECTPASTALNTPTHSDNEESSEQRVEEDLAISTNPIEIIQNSPMISFTQSPVKVDPYEHLLVEKQSKSHYSEVDFQEHTSKTSEDIDVSGSTSKMELAETSKKVKQSSNGSAVLNGRKIIASDSKEDARINEHLAQDRKNVNVQGGNGRQSDLSRLSGTLTLIDKTNASVSSLRNKSQTGANNELCEGDVLRTVKIDKKKLKHVRLVAKSSDTKTSAKAPESSHRDDESHTRNSLKKDNSISENSQHKKSSNWSKHERVRRLRDVEELSSSQKIARSDTDESTGRTKDDFRNNDTENSEETTTVLETIGHQRNDQLVESDSRNDIRTYVAKKPEFEIQVTNLNLKIKDNEKTRENTNKSLDAIKIEINLSCNSRDNLSKASGKNTAEEITEHIGDLLQAETSSRTIDSESKSSSKETKNSEASERSFDKTEAKDTEPAAEMIQNNACEVLNPQDIEKKHSITSRHTEVPKKFPTVQKVESKDSHVNREKSRNVYPGTNAGTSFSKNNRDADLNFDFNRFDVVCNENAEPEEKKKKSDRKFGDNFFSSAGGYVNPIFTSSDDPQNLNAVPVYTTKDGKITYSPNPRYTYRVLIMEAREREGSTSFRKEPSCYRPKSLSCDHYEYSKSRKSHKKKRSTAETEKKKQHHGRTTSYELPNFEDACGNKNYSRKNRSAHLEYFNDDAGRAFKEKEQPKERLEYYNNDAGRAFKGKEQGKDVDASKKHIFDFINHERKYYGTDDKAHPVKIKSKGRSKSDDLTECRRSSEGNLVLEHRKMCWENPMQSMNFFPQTDSRGSSGIQNRNFAEAETSYRRDTCMSSACRIRERRTSEDLRPHRENRECETFPNISVMPLQLEKLKKSSNESNAEIKSVSPDTEKARENVTNIEKTRTDVCEQEKQVDETSEATNEICAKVQKEQPEVPEAPSPTAASSSKTESIEPVTQLDTVSTEQNEEVTAETCSYSESVDYVETSDPPHNVTVPDADLIATNESSTPPETSSKPEEEVREENPEKNFVPEYEDISEKETFETTRNDNDTLLNSEVNNIEVTDTQQHELSHQDVIANEDIKSVSELTANKINEASGVSQQTDSTLVQLANTAPESSHVISCENREEIISNEDANETYEEDNTSACNQDITKSENHPEEERCQQKQLEENNRELNHGYEEPECSNVAFQKGDQIIEDLPMCTEDSQLSHQTNQIDTNNTSEDTIPSELQMEYEINAKTVPKLKLSLYPKIPKMIIRNVGSRPETPIVQEIPEEFNCQTSKPEQSIFQVETEKNNDERRKDSDSEASDKELKEDYEKIPKMKIRLEERSPKRAKTESEASVKRKNTKPIVPKMKIKKLKAPEISEDISDVERSVQVSSSNKSQESTDPEKRTERIPKLKLRKQELDRSLSPETRKRPSSTIPEMSPLGKRCRKGKEEEKKHSLIHMFEKIPKVIIKRSSASAEFKCEISKDGKDARWNVKNGKDVKSEISKDAKWQPEVKLQRSRLLDRLVKDLRCSRLSLSSLKNEDAFKSQSGRRLSRSNSMSNLSPAKRKQRRMSDYDYVKTNESEAANESSSRTRNSYSLRKDSEAHDSVSSKEGRSSRRSRRNSLKSSSTERNETDEELRPAKSSKTLFHHFSAHDAGRSKTNESLDIEEETKDNMDEHLTNKEVNVVRRDRSYASDNENESIDKTSKSGLPGKFVDNDNSVIKLDSSDDSQTTIEILPASPDENVNIKIEHAIEDENGRLYTEDAIPTQFELELDVTDNSNADSFDVSMPKLTKPDFCIPKDSKYVSSSDSEHSDDSERDSVSTGTLREEKRNKGKRASIEDENFWSNDSLIKKVLAAKKALKRCLSRSENETQCKGRPKTAAEKKQGSSFDLSTYNNASSESNAGQHRKSITSNPDGRTTVEKSEKKHSRGKSISSGKKTKVTSKSEKKSSSPVRKNEQGFTISLKAFKRFGQVQRISGEEGDRPHSQEEKIEDESEKDTNSKEDMPVLEPEALNFDPSSDRDSSRSPPVITNQDGVDVEVRDLKATEEKITATATEATKNKKEKKCELTIADIITELAYHEKATIKHRRYCNLCERWFPTTSRHRRHLAGYQHRHIELTQRRSIHALFMLFTGKPCPRLVPANIVRNDCSIGELTPLQIAVQDVAMCLERKQNVDKDNDVNS